VAPFQDTGGAPRQYGAWETINNIRGSSPELDVIASKMTRARLRRCGRAGYEEDPAVDPKVAEYSPIPKRLIAEFDLIHSHWTSWLYTGVKNGLTTIHGFRPNQRVYRSIVTDFVSISDSDRPQG
jgi:hypothetical protein